MKNVSVIGMHEAAGPSRKENARRQPTVEQARHAPDRPRLRRVRVNDIRPLPPEQPEQFPDRDHIAPRNLAAHLRDNERLDALRGGEITHVILARRHSPCHQY